MSNASNVAEVLITVKASPQPSAQHGDTVCVAGVRIDDGVPRWIRLYPIDFRWLDGEMQFNKYDVLRFDIKKARADDRLESYTPIRGWKELSKIPTEGNWKRRHDYIGKLPETSTCTLSSDATRDGKAASLGLVPVADISKLTFAKHDPWDEAQLKKMRDRVVREESALFSLGTRIPPILETPRFKVSYQYRCEDSSCGGHTGQILDWELGALQRHYKHALDEEVKRHITTNFLDKMWSSGRWTAFFMGNFADPRKRHSFSVLGTYYPPRETVEQVSLF